MNFNDKLKVFLSKCENPQVYTGKEINVIKKDYNLSNINICLVFPDKYEIGMSHYGIKLLYHLLNKIENVNVERCFLPDKNSMNLLKNLDLPLFSIENKIPLKEFDLIGLSLLSEMNYTNLLAVLDLAQMPFFSSDRKEKDPLVIAGGISVINPEPIRSFIDAFAIGDGEELFKDILSVLLERKKKKISKIHFLNKLGKKKGFYVPALFKLKKDGCFTIPDIPVHFIKKKVLKKMDSIVSEDKIIVPITNVVFDRLDVEIARGCPQNCRFCQAKSYYSPYRFKNPDLNLSLIKNGLANTGFESAALSTLSAGDYPYIEELLSKIPDCLPSSTSISFSSLRPSSISDQLLGTIAQFRKTGLTIVPEAGSERLRRVINKNVTDSEIFTAVDKAIKFGWQKIKLYFMIGLPTETETDILAITNLIKKIIDLTKKKKKKLKITVSFSSFVPKPHTPLQWAKRENPETLKLKIKMIRTELSRHRFLALDFHKINRGIIETVLARGDSLIGPLLLNVYKKGELFSAWDSEFNYDIWKEEMDKFDYEIYLNELDVNQRLPWDFMEINFNKEFIKNDYINALHELPSVSCNETECKTCNGCNYRFSKPVQLGSKQSIKPYIVNNLETNTTEYNKVRIYFEKKNDFKYFSHLSMSKYIERIIRKSKLSFKSTEGFRPRIKIAYLPPLPVYAIGEKEVIELFIDNSYTEKMIKDKLDEMSGELSIISVSICNGSKSLNKDINFIMYELNTEIDDKQKDEINKVIREKDKIDYLKNRIQVKIDYKDRGPEQFSKIYKILDPEKKNTKNIIRKEIVF